METPMEVDDAPPTASEPSQRDPQDRQPSGEGELGMIAAGDERNDNDDDAPPASPPLPSKHTAVTPGPRAARLQDVFADRLRRTLDRVSWPNFAACYPTMAANAPATLQFVQRQMVERLGAQCQKEFDTVLENRHVVAKLNELESLVSDATRRRGEAHEEDKSPVPPHLLPASAILSAHLAPLLAAQNSQLNARLQTVQALNARLFADVQCQRAEARALLHAVDKVLADADAAASLLDGVVDDLSRETRATEGQTA